MAVIYTSEDKKTGEIVVLKQMLIVTDPNDNQNALVCLEKEAEMHRVFNHPRLARARDTLKTKTKNFFVMEFIDGMSPKN